MLMQTKQANLVRIYRNLNNGKISIQDKKTNLVVGYADAVYLVPHTEQTAVKCVVLQGGRNRVLKEKRKNVHAYLEGAIASFTNFEPLKGRSFEPCQTSEDGSKATTALTYNPYKMDTFSIKATLKAVKTLASVLVACDGSMKADIK